MITLAPAPCRHLILTLHRVWILSPAAVPNGINRVSLRGPDPGEARLTPRRPSILRRDGTNRWLQGWHAPVRSASRPSGLRPALRHPADGGSRAGRRDYAAGGGGRRGPPARCAHAGGMGGGGSSGSHSVHGPTPRPPYMVSLLHLYTSLTHRILAEKSLLIANTRTRKAPLSLIDLCRASAGRMVASFTGMVSFTHTCASAARFPQFGLPIHLIRLSVCYSIPLTMGPSHIPITL